jgi:D-sedoheptulose 7-phosphate isomerase
MKDMTLKIKEKDCRIILIGNGASASMASHTAADLSKNAWIQAEVFTDLALITALGNDLCFEEVFAEPLKWRLKQDDMLVAISSSGQSPNIIRAAGEAVNRGSLLITLSAMKPDNPLRKLGSLNFYVPAQA